jgi:hypothetical protein
MSSLNPLMSVLTATLALQLAACKPDGVSSTNGLDVSGAPSATAAGQGVGGRFTVRLPGGSFATYEYAVTPASSGAVFASRVLSVSPDLEGRASGDNGLPLAPLASATCVLPSCAAYGDARVTLETTPATQSARVLSYYGYTDIENDPAPTRVLPTPGPAQSPAVAPVVTDHQNEIAQTNALMRQNCPEFFAGTSTECEFSDGQGNGYGASYPTTSPHGDRPHDTSGADHALGQ